MNQRNTSGILGLFVAFVLIIGVVSFFVQIISYLFPFIAIIVFFAIFWGVIKNFIATNRTDGGTNQRRSGRTRQQQTRKKKSGKEPIDVEYTVIDEDASKKQKKNEKNER